MLALSRLRPTPWAILEWAVLRCRFARFASSSGPFCWAWLPVVAIGSERVNIYLRHERQLWGNDNPPHLPDGQVWRILFRGLMPLLSSLFYYAVAVGIEQFFQVGYL